MISKKRDKRKVICLLITLVFIATTIFGFKSISSISKSKCPTELTILEKELKSDFDDGWGKE